MDRDLAEFIATHGRHGAVRGREHEIRVLCGFNWMGAGQSLEGTAAVDNCRLPYRANFVPVERQAR